MEIPEKLYHWLQQTGIFTGSPTISQGKVFLPEADALRLDNGVAFVRLLERLHTAFHEFEPFHMPELKTLEDSANRNAKLHNWNILTKALEQFGIHLDSNLKTLIVAGDRQLVLELAKDIQQTENLAIGRDPDQSFASPKRKRKKKVNIRGALLLSNLNPNFLLSDAESALEFLLLSLCHNLRLTPKQAAGLLTQGGKYLEHLVIKGLKGDYRPVTQWYSAVIENADVLARCVEQELPSGALGLALSTLQTGLRSLDVDVIALASTSLMTLHSYLKFQENDIWEWFLANNVFNELMEVYKIAPNDLTESVAGLLYGLAKKRLLQVFGEMLFDYYAQPAEYFASSLSFIQVLIKDPRRRQHMENEGLVLHWMEQGLRECAGKKSPSVRLAAILFLCEVWIQFPKYVDRHESLANSLLTELNKSYKDKSRLLKLAVIGKVFQVLVSFLHKQNVYASIVYKSLAFALTEHVKVESVREFILANFIQLLEDGCELNIGVLLDPIIKQMGTLHAFNPLDFDFLVSCASYHGLELKQASNLIEWLGRLYLTDLRYSNAAGVPLVRLIGRFRENPAIQQQVAQLLLSGFARLMQQAKPLPLRSGLDDAGEDRELLYARNQLFNIVEKCLKFGDEMLTQLIQDLLLTAASEAKRTNARLTNGINVLLNTSGLKMTMSIFGQQSMRSTRTDRIGTPRSRARMNIEKLAQDRQAIEVKRRSLSTQQELQDTKVKKSLRKAIEAKRVQHAITSKLSETDPVIKKARGDQDAMQFIDPEEGTEFEQDLLYIILKRYSRPIKALFNQYAVSNIQQSPQQREDFDRHNFRVIKEGAALKMLRDFGVTKEMINNHHVNAIFSYLMKKYKALSLTQEAFVSFLYQASLVIFRKGSGQSLAQFPPAISVKALFEQFAQSGVWSRKLFDEPDPGAGDREVVATLNEQLQHDPDTPLPEGYKRVKDFVITVSYNMPDQVDMPESTTIALELLDDILSEEFGVHILEPYVDINETYRVKGVLNRPQIQNSDEYYANPIGVPQNKAGYRLFPLPSFVKVTPNLKVELSRLTGEYPHDTLLECARVVDDLVHSVHEGSEVVISRNPRLASTLENPLTKKKAQEAQLKNAIRRRSEEKRQKRIEELKAELQKHHTELDKKRREEETQRAAQEAARQKLLRDQQVIREKAKAEFLKKHKKQGTPLPDDLQDKNFFSEERRKLLHYNQKRRQELEKTHPKPSSRWPARNRYSLVKILQPKVMEAAVQLKDSWSAWDDPQVQAVIKKYSVPLATLYATYTRQKVEAIAPQAFLLKMNEFSRMCTHLNILPALITSEKVQQIFNALSKKSTESFLGLSLRTFKRALVRIAVFSKDTISHDLEKPGGSAVANVQNLFEWLCLPLEAKAARDFVKGLEDNIAIVNPRDKKKQKNALVKQLMNSKA